MGPTKYSLLSAVYHRVVGRPHRDMYKNQTYSTNSSQLAEDKQFNNWNILGFFEGVLLMYNACNVDVFVHPIVLVLV